MRLIDADEVLARIENPYQRAEIARWLRDAPTIEERKTGKWLKGDEMPDYPRVPYKSWLTYCSACRSQTEMETDFCPNCGADMRGEQIG